MAGKLDGKVVVVTGGETGIGRAIVEKCLDDGAEVTAAGINTDHLKSLDDSAATDRLLCVETDVRDPVAINDMLTETKDKFGRLDGAVANAGITLGQTPFVDITLEDWDTMLGMNLRSVFMTLQAAAKILVAQGEGGSLLATGSSTAVRVAPGFASYIAAKGGVHAMMQALALELAENKIKANTIVPGTTRSPLTEALPGYLEKVGPTLPMGEVVEPYELANFVAFALSDEAPHMTGTLLKVDAGRVLG